MTIETASYRITKLGDRWVVVAKETGHVIGHVAGEKMPWQSRVMHELILECEAGSYARQLSLNFDGARPERRGVSNETVVSIRGRLAG